MGPEYRRYGSDHHTLADHQMAWAWRCCHGSPSAREDVAALTVDDADLELQFSLAAPSERTPGTAARAMIAMAREFLWQG